MRSSSWTARSSRPRSAPAPRTISATPGATPRSSRTPTTTRPATTNNNAGHISVNRWHITDNVPFQTSFEADIEKYYKNDRPTLYAATAYWYQAPGQPDVYTSVPAADRVGYFEPAK